MMAVGVLAAATLVGGVSSQVMAQTAGRPERYNATAINMGGGRVGGGPAMAGRVLIAVNRWTTQRERQSLLAVLTERGPEKLLDALRDQRSTGTIRLPDTLAWDLRYAYQSPLPDGGRRVVLATDRPIGFREASANQRTMDYPYTLVEIRFDKNGVGVGKMSVRTKITMSKDKQTMELENFGIEPVRLTEVRIEQ
jgi:hypothetical protein